jgi:hypothetical protein
MAGERIPHPTTLSWRFELSWLVSLPRANFIISADVGAMADMD